MSGLFDDREKSYENKFAHDQEIEFKIMARANKLFGLWAAEQMGMDGVEALEYAMSVVETGLKQSGEWDVMAKVTHDLTRKHVHMHKDDLKERYMALHLEASRQIKEDSASS